MITLLMSRGGNHGLSDEVFVNTQEEFMIMLGVSLVAGAGILASNTSPTLTSCPYSMVGGWL